MFEVLEKMFDGSWSVVPDTECVRPDLAKEIAKKRSDILGIVHKIQKVAIENDDWKKREQGRIDSGEYSLPKWLPEDLDLLKRYPDHFVHLSEKKDGRFAFTENADKGQANRQTAILVGRYLTKYHDDILSPEKISMLSSLCGDTGLEILTDTDEIVAAYLDGPRSCMSKTVDHYSSDIHPTSVYGNGSDLGLAILRRDGHISSRCVVWPDKKYYGRIYGDDERMRVEIRKLDYHNGGDFRGAKLNKIAHRDGEHFVCPYLDGLATVRIGTDFLFVDDCGDHIADSESGLLGYQGYECEGCGCSVDEDDIRYSDITLSTYCEGCYDERFSTCDECGEQCDREDLSYIESEGIDVAYCCADQFADCDDCGEHIRQDDLQSTPSDTYVCETCFDDNGHGRETCENCGEQFDDDDLNYNADQGRVCGDCDRSDNDSDDDQLVDGEHENERVSA